MLASQCSVWADELAAVVYVPTVAGKGVWSGDPSLQGSSLNDTAQRVAALYERLQREGAGARAPLALQGWAGGRLGRGSRVQQFVYAVL